MDEITWQTLEFEKHEKSGNWFVALWIIVAGLVVVSFLTKSLFMGILVIVAGAILSLFAAKEPREIEITLTGKRIILDGKPHGLDSFSSFWIFEEEDAYSTLSLTSNKNFQPHLKIILPEEIISDVRMILRPTLEEEEQEESLIERLADWLKF